MCGGSRATAVSTIATQLASRFVLCNPIALIWSAQINQTDDSELDYYQLNSTLKEHCKPKKRLASNQLYGLWVDGHWIFKRSKWSKRCAFPR